MIFCIVDGRRHYWHDGESVLFDDTYMREVHNKTDERRIALLLDVKRDDLSTPMRIFDWFYYKLFQAYIIACGGLNQAQAQLQTQTQTQTQPQIQKFNFVKSYDKIIENLRSKFLKI